MLDAVMRAEWPPELLLIAAGPPATPQELSDLTARGLQGRVIILGRVPNEQLSRWYRDSVCFAFPSKCEGFGFPLIEAQLAGAPVICSDIPVFREIAGKGAHFVKSDDAGGFARAAAAILSSPPPEQSIEQARANAHRFTWARCAAETLSIYNEARLSV
jgi:glycosyltransferase involved in cell wall biosynthesis